MSWLDTEIDRKYHPVANLGQNQKACTHIISDDRQSVTVIDISPSTYDGYFYVSWLNSETGMCEFLNKPVNGEYLSLVLDSIGIDLARAEWAISPCAPQTCCPYVPKEPQSKKREQRVYFICGGGLVKIGVAESPEERMDNLQAGSPVPLYLLATIPGGFEKEGELHAKFASSRRHGEWFELTPDLEEYIRECQTQAS